MAHLIKIKRAQAHGIIAHCKRTKCMGENVDQSLSSQNMSWVSSEEKLPVEAEYENRLKRFKVQNRSDVNTLASWVVTLPNDMDVSDRQEMKRFFSETTSFIMKRYPKSVLAGYVHMDEPNARPHVHVLMVPVVEERKKNKETQKKEPTGRWKVSAKELFTKSDLKTFHTDLSQHLKIKLGREVAVLRDSITLKQGGNRTISQLKLDTAREKAAEEGRKSYEARHRSQMAEAAADAAKKEAEEAMRRAELTQLELEHAKKEYEKAKRELATRLVEAHKEAERILEKSERQAEEILNKAQEEADKLITDVNEEIAKARAVKRPARRVTVRRNDGKNRGQSR